jgi:hypothetical protein
VVRGIILNPHAISRDSKPTRRVANSWISPDFNPLRLGECDASEVVKQLRITKPIHELLIEHPERVLHVPFRPAEYQRSRVGSKGFVAFAIGAYPKGQTCFECFSPPYFIVGIRKDAQKHRTAVKCCLADDWDMPNHCNTSSGMSALSWTDRTPFKRVIFGAIEFHRHVN